MICIDISVVIPAFNAAKYLGASLDSVFAQDVSGIEVIVVDDGSSDETRSIAEAYGSRLRYVWQPNSGACSAPRNHGARVSSGEFLTFFDADDVMMPRKLSSQLNALRTCPDAAMVLSDYRNFDSSGDHPSTHFESCTQLLSETGLLVDGKVVLPPVTSNRMLIRENFAIASSPLFRRDAWLDAGGFDQSLSASEDFDLIYRMSRRHPTLVLRQVGFRRRLHGENMSNQTLRILESKARSRRKLLAAETAPGLRQALRTSIAEFELARCRALHDAHRAGAFAAYFRSMAQDPKHALAAWRTFVRALPLASRSRAFGSGDSSL